MVQSPLDPTHPEGRIEPLDAGEKRRLRAIAARAAGAGGAEMQRSVEREWAGRLRRWPRPIRAALLALLEGHSRRAACAAVGHGPQWLDRLAQRSEALAIDLTDAEQIGLGSIIEGEIWRRALSGEADRGSMQALLALARARIPEYREQSMVQLDISRRAADAIRAIAAGWQESAVDAVVIEGAGEGGALPPAGGATYRE